MQWQKKFPVKKILTLWHFMFTYFLREGASCTMSSYAFQLGLVPSYCFLTLEWKGEFIKKGKSFYNHHHNILKQTSYAGSPHHQQHINSHNFSQNRVDHHADQKEKKNMMYRQRLLMLTRQLHRMWTKQHNYMNVCMWIV